MDGTLPGRGRRLGSDLAAILLSAGGDREALDTLGRILDALPVGIAVYDASDDDFRVLYMNAAALAGPHAKRGAQTGLPVVEVFENAAGFPAIFRGIRDRRERFTAKAFPSAAGERVYDIDVFPVEDPSGRVTHLIGTWQNVTDQVSARDRLEALLATTEVLSGPVPVEGVAGLVVEEAARLLPGVSCALELETSLARLAGPEEAVHEVDLGGSRLVFRRSGRDFREDERLLMRAFGRRAALAMERGRLLAESEAIARRLETAMKVALDLSGSLDPSAVMAQILRRAIEAADADRALLMTVEGGELLVVDGQDREGFDVEPGRRVALDDDPEGAEALRTRHPVLGGPYKVVVGQTAAQLAAGAIRHTARVPLILGNRATALLVLGRRRDEPFSEADVAMLDVLAGHAAVAMRNARLFSETESVRRTLQIGIDATLDLASILEQEEVIARLLVRALETTDADRIVLFRKDGTEIFTEAGHDRDALPILLGTPYMAALGDLIELAERQRAPVAFGGFGAERLAQVTEELRGVLAATRHSVLVPLFDNDRPVAHLLLMRRRGEAFDPDAISTLKLIGNAAVLAMRNAAMFRDLHEAGRVKSQFLNMAAHELRTPLSVISGYVSMLADGTLGEAPARWQAPLQVLVAKTQELGHLVDDILLAARLEGGTATDRMQPLDVRGEASEALQRAAARAELLLAHMELELPEEPVLARADRDHLARILDNLINNALTYRRGAPWVKVSVRAAGGEVRIAVEDRGRGIPRKHHEQVFQQFVRVEDAKHGYPPGTGLGLYISRALAGRQGGRLVLEWSEPKQGSRFVLTLPAVRP